MWWANPLCNSAEDLGTLAENEAPTGYEPNEYHSLLLQLDRLQLTAVCCNRRGV